VGPPRYNHPKVILISPAQRSLRRLGPVRARSKPGTVSCPSALNIDGQATFANYICYSRNLDLPCIYSRFYGQAERAISNGQLHKLPCFHFRPIDVVVFHGPSYLSVGKTHLGEGFTLICLQRLSRPDFATQLCHWRDNWITRGLFIPVLSY
jgi:hypothetical protein